MSSSQPPHEEGKFFLTSEDRLFFIPGMRPAAMRAGDVFRFQLGVLEEVLVDRDSGDIKFFRYRTSHQNSLDHSANMP